MPIDQRYAALASCQVRVWAVVGLIAVGGGNASAQTASPAGQATPTVAAPQAEAGVDLEQLLGIEVQSVFGASRFLQKSTEAPAAVTVVTADEIWRYGWRTLADVLRSVRGFYVTDDRAWAYVGLRGFQRTGDYNTRILLLLDGQRTNDNIYDQALIQEDFLVDLADVERIEIIRGPSSSLYGSNAFFGVINVVTRGPSPDRPATASVDLGTLGLRTERVSIGRQVGDDLAIRLSASLQRREGLASFYTPEFDNGGPGAGVAHDLDYTNRENVFVQGKYRRVAFSGGYNRRKRGLPTGAYDVVRNHPDTWVTDRHVFTEARVQGIVGRAWDTEIRGRYDNHEYVGSYPYLLDEAAPRVAPNLDVGRGQWLTGGLQLSRLVAGRHRLTLGAERRQHLEERMLNYYSGTSPLLDVNRRSSTTGVYLQDEWRPHASLLLNAGVRYDRYAAFSDPVKPRAAAIYQMAKRTTLKLMYGEAFRAPTVYETDYAYPGTYLANPNLTPEETRRVEALVEHYAGSRARLTASWFRYHVSGLIDQRFEQAQSASIYDNVASVSGSGFETEAEVRWPRGPHILGSYTYSRLRATTSERLTNSPAHIGQFRASAPAWAGTTLALDLHALSSRWTPRGTVVGAYLVPNLTLSRVARGRGLGFSFTVANFTNTAYADPVSTDFDQASVTQDGRTARLRLSWSF